jgi:hypothetical protein
MLVLVAWVLLPLWLSLRSRQGRARRRLVPWLVRRNAWVMLGSAGVLVASMALTGHWWPDALAHALCGLVAGLCTGTLAVLLGHGLATAWGPALATAAQALSDQIWSSSSLSISIALSVARAMRSTTSCTRRTPSSLGASTSITE